MCVIQPVGLWIFSSKISQIPSLALPVADIGRVELILGIFGLSQLDLVKSPRLVQKKSHQRAATAKTSFPSKLEFITDCFSKVINQMNEGWKNLQNKFVRETTCVLLFNCWQSVLRMKCPFVLFFGLVACDGGGDNHKNRGYCLTSFSTLF